MDHLPDELVTDLAQHPAGHLLFEAHLPPPNALRGVISIPHAGQFIPPELKDLLYPTPWAWGQDVDFEVHQLLDLQALCEQGIAVLKSHIHRIVCDLNRPPSRGIFAWPNNSQQIPLLKHLPSPQQTRQLLHSYHAPWFEALGNILTIAGKGKLPLIDLHSMPSQATPYHFQQNPKQTLHRPDFCLSDRQGETCSQHYIALLEQTLTAHGHHVLINQPYVGGYITQFAHPLSPHNLQIEINRSLYMDEQKRELTAGAKTLRQQLTATLLQQWQHFAP